MSEVTADGVEVDGEAHDEETEAPATNVTRDAPAPSKTKPMEPLPKSLFLSKQYP